MACKGEKLRINYRYDFPIFHLGRFVFDPWTDPRILWSLDLVRSYVYKVTWVEPESNLGRGCFFCGDFVWNWEPDFCPIPQRTKSLNRNSFEYKRKEWNERL